MTSDVTGHDTGLCFIHSICGLKKQSPFESEYFYLWVRHGYWQHLKAVFEPKIPNGGAVFSREVCVCACVVKTGLEQIVFGPGVLSPVCSQTTLRSRVTVKGSTSRQRQKGGGRQSFLWHLIDTIEWRTTYSCLHLQSRSLRKWDGIGMFVAGADPSRCPAVTLSVIHAVFCLSLSPQVWQDCLDQGHLG